MSKPLRLCIIYALILSPFVVNVIASRFVPTQDNPVLLLIESVGVAIIGIVGVAFSALIRKKSHAGTLSLLGYAIPAIIVAAYIILRLP